MKLLTATDQDILREFSSLWPQFYYLAEQAFIRVQACSSLEVYHPLLLQSLPNLRTVNASRVGQILMDNDLTRFVLTSFVSRTALRRLLQRFWCLLEVFSLGSGFRSNEKCIPSLCSRCISSGGLGLEGFNCIIYTPPARGCLHRPSFLS
jgi:hypothetical protein